MIMVTAALIAGLIIAGFAAVSSYYEYHGIGLQRGVFRKAPDNQDRIAALTFDDGPSLHYTPQILDILAAKQVRATFFLTGQMAEEHPDIARRIVAEGHEIGNHTYSHVNMIFLNRLALADEIDRGHQAIVAATGVAPTLFRPPRGLFNEKVRTALVGRGYQIILWSVSAADWGLLSANTIAWRIRHFAHPGAVYLFHDGGALIKNNGGKRAKTVAVLPVAIDYLRGQGYSLVTVGEMAARN